MFVLIVGKSSMAILTINSTMAILVPILKDHKWELYGCLKKVWPTCRSPVKTVMKKMDYLKSYDKTKKVDKNINFWANFFVKLIIKRRVWHTWKKKSNLNKIFPLGSLCPFTVPPVLHSKDMDTFFFLDTLFRTT